MSHYNRSRNPTGASAPLQLAPLLGPMMLLALSITPAQAQTTPTLSVNGDTSAAVTACSSSPLNFLSTYPTAFYGSWDYTWKLYKNGGSQPIYQTTETIDCDSSSGGPCQLPSFSQTVAAAGGSYSVKLEAKQFPTVQGPWSSAAVNVSLGSGCATPRLKINGVGSSCPVNGKSTWPVDVCAASSITLDGSGKACTATSSHYFVSVQLSDAYWNTYNNEAMRWLSAADYSNYGPIGAFNVKRFAEDQWFHFVGGQYYRIKLATDLPWRETATLVYIRPSAAALTVNGNPAHGPISVPRGGPFVINGTASSCAQGYFVGVQLSDASWNRYGTEVNGWLTPTDFAQYGTIASFDVKGFAASKGLTLTQGHYYRVKLAVGSPWSEASRLILITP